MSNETNSNASSEDDLGTGILYVEDIVVYQEPVLATPKRVQILRLRLSRNIYYLSIETNNFPLHLLHTPEGEGVCIRSIRLRKIHQLYAFVQVFEESEDFLVC